MEIDLEKLKKLIDETENLQSIGKLSIRTLDLMDDALCHSVWFAKKYIEETTLEDLVLLNTLVARLDKIKQTYNESL